MAVAFQESPERVATAMVRPSRSVGREGAGVPLEASSPDTTLQPGRGPSRDGFRGRGLERRDQLIRVRGSGTELAVEGLIDEGAQPGAGVEVPAGADELEALTGFGRDTDMKWNTVQHKTHNNT